MLLSGGWIWTQAWARRRRVRENSGGPPYTVELRHAWRDRRPLALSAQERRCPAPLPAPCERGFPTPSAPVSAPPSAPPATAPSLTTSFPTASAPGRGTRPLCLAARRRLDSSRGMRRPEQAADCP